MTPTGGSRLAAREKGLAGACGARADERVPRRSEGKGSRAYAAVGVGACQSGAGRQLGCGAEAEAGVEQADVGWANAVRACELG